MSSLCAKFELSGREVLGASASPTSPNVPRLRRMVPAMLPLRRLTAALGIRWRIPPYPYAEPLALLVLVEATLLGLREVDIVGESGTWSLDGDTGIAASVTRLANIPERRLDTTFRSCLTTLSGVGEESSVIRSGESIVSGSVSSFAVGRRIAPSREPPSRARKRLKIAPAMLC